MRRFCLQNVESILEYTKKGLAHTDKSLSLYAVHQTNDVIVNHYAKK